MWNTTEFLHINNQNDRQSHLSDDDLALCSNDDKVCNISTREESSPFLGGSTTTTSEPMIQERGSYQQENEII